MDWPSILVSGAAVVAASVGAAYLTARATARSQHRRWRADMAEKYATLVGEHPARAQALARQFAVGVLIIEGKDPAERDKVFVAPHTRMTVGRDPSNEVVLATIAASRRHFAISADDSHVYVEDLGSANGTFVNDQYVMARTLLRSGDILRVDSSMHIEFQTLMSNL
jgi:pSer/pThr/pTyr-binding forkhead associated (FHA) protein